MEYTFEEQKAIEEAIKYVVFSFHESGRNPKPVVLHSIRTGLNLYYHGYVKDIIVSGILHDLIEDTEISYEDIRAKFGEKIARLVQACSFDASIEDLKERYIEADARALKEGKEALIIKTADIIDNMPYMLDEKYGSGNMIDHLREKIDYFIRISNDILSAEDIFQEMVTMYNERTGTSK